MLCYKTQTLPTPLGVTMAQQYYGLCESGRKKERKSAHRTLPHAMVIPESPSLDLRLPQTASTSSNITKAQQEALKSS